MCVYHLHAMCNAHCGQKWASVLLELELQKAVSCHMGAETEPRSSARATSTLTTEPPASDVCYSCFLKYWGLRLEPIKC